MLESVGINGKNIGKWSKVKKITMKNNNENNNE